MLCGADLHLHRMLPRSHPGSLSILANKQAKGKSKYLKGEREGGGGDGKTSVRLTLKTPAGFCQQKKKKKNPNQNKPNQPTKSSTLQIKKAPALGPRRRYHSPGSPPPPPPPPGALPGPRGCSPEGATEDGWPGLPSPGIPHPAAKGHRTGQGEAAQGKAGGGGRGSPLRPLGMLRWCRGADRSSIDLRMAPALLSPALWWWRWW